MKEANLLIANKILKLKERLSLYENYNMQRDYRDIYVIIDYSFDLGLISRAEYLCYIQFLLDLKFINIDKNYIKF